jgi:hypothetical protein
LIKLGRPALARRLFIRWQALSPFPVLRTSF